MKKFFDSIEDAIKAIKKGKVIIVVDDESRENEGDFICASEKVTPEIINFMSKKGRGLICCSLDENRCESLGLDLMVGKNTDNFNTSFTVSVDLKGKGVSTGISVTVSMFIIQLLILKEPILNFSQNYWNIHVFLIYFSLFFYATLVT